MINNDPNGIYATKCVLDVHLCILVTDYGYLWLYMI